ncbi:MAG: hypothetical protein R2865_06170 [Deinococcales bacterium]
MVSLLPATSVGIVEPNPALTAEVVEVVVPEVAETVEIVAVSPSSSSAETALTQEVVQTQPIAVTPPTPQVSLNRVATVRVPGANGNQNQMISASAMINPAMTANLGNQVNSLPTLSQSPAAPVVTTAVTTAAPQAQQGLSMAPLGLSTAQNFSNRIDTLEAEETAALERAKREEEAKLRAQQQAQIQQAQQQAAARAAEQARLEAEKAATEQARLEAEKAAAEARLEAERLAAEARIEAERKAQVEAARQEPAISVSAGLSGLNRYIRDQNLRFTGTVLGPISLAIFESRGRSFSVQLGQNLPDTDIRLTSLNGQEAELSQGDEKQILLLDIRR